MSFVLPRNVPKLTFTGSVRALGQKRPPPLPPRAHDVYANENVPTPYLGSRPHMEAARPRLDSAPEDDVATLAMSRELVERGLERRTPLPAFHRNAVATAGPALIPTPDAPVVRGGRSPVMTLFWIVTAILCGLLSYRYAPDLVERLRDTGRLF